MSMSNNSPATEVLPALQVADIASVSWDHHCDVLVVGWGAAGACAALEARAQGADVLIADRFTGGGASARSGGVVYAGGGTRHQQAAGFNDSPEAMFDYLKHETQNVISDDTLRRFCADSVGNLEWLEAHGAPYAHRMPPGARPRTRPTATSFTTRVTSWCPTTAAPCHRPRGVIARWARDRVARCFMPTSKPRA